MVGQDADDLAAVELAANLAHRVLKGIAAAAPLPSRQVADAVGQDRCSRGDRQFLDHGQGGYWILSRVMVSARLRRRPRCARAIISASNSVKRVLDRSWLALAKVERRGSSAPDDRAALGGSRPRRHSRAGSPPGKLTIDHGQKLALAGQTPRSRIRPMHPRQPLKIIPRHMLQQLIKNAIAVPHGIDPRSRPDRPQTSWIDRHQCRASGTAKNEPDSRGLDPAIHAFEGPKEDVDTRDKPAQDDYTLFAA